MLAWNCSKGRNNCKYVFLWQINLCSLLQATLYRSNVQIKEALQHSKDLEVQLAEARNGNGGMLPLWALAVIVICIIIIVVLILK